MTCRRGSGRCPCRKVNGIGPRTDEKLQLLGIHTVGDIAARDRGWLMEHFGRSHGAWLHEASWGRDERAVVTESEPVSISRETTFERDLHAVRDRADLSAIFTRLCEQVAADLQRKGYAAGPSASSCASTTSRRLRATPRLMRLRLKPEPSAVRRD